MAERPLWQPSEERIEEANLTRFARQAIRDWKLGINTYRDFYRWTTDRPEQFWESLWRFAGVRASRKGERALLDGDRMPGAKWFPDARLNFAENLLRRRDAATAIVFWGEDRVKRRLTHRELYDLVSRTAQALRALGVKPGDRVAAYLPNMPEAAAVMLAVSSLGAVLSTSSPDFGVQGVLDRFGQIGPVVLFAADGYFYSGKVVGSLDRVRDIAARIPSLRRVVVVPYVSARPDVSAVAGAQRLDEFIAGQPGGDIRFEQLPFDHPLYILFSSGTTGAPKCIVHGQGGTLLKHLCEQQLHCDVQAGDRLFFFTTCGWMMWNWLVSGLASGATLLLYDGSPFVHQGKIVWELADTERMTHLGTSAKYIDAIKKIALVPRKDYALSSLRAVLSTGSPLAPEGFDYVYQCIKGDVCLSSISGGTDIISCFALGCPTRPVWRGELQCRGLGMRVDVFDENGNNVQVQKGELVCTAPFPSM